MFERFTKPARQAIVMAEADARSLGHSLIRPEHILLGVSQAGGVAGSAMDELGVNAAGLRDRVGAAFARTADARQASRVPFSPEAKRSLERALRDAVGRGHNYIGTEHLLLGVLAGTETDGATADAVLGVDRGHLRALVVARMADAPDAERLSPALLAAMHRAREVAGSSPTTTGHLLDAMLGDPRSQASIGLDALGITADAVRGQLAAIPVPGTSDAPPAPRTVALTVGDVSVTIDDPALAAALTAMSPDQLRAALRHVAPEDPSASSAGGGRS